MPRIEIAGGQSMAAVNESRRSVTASAPAWWKKLARETAHRGFRGPAQPSARPTAQPAAARRCAGWLVGVCSPGVSRPAFGSIDKEHLPEQFTDRCLQRLYDQLRSGQQGPTLQWGHDGVVLTSGILDLTFRYNAIVGLEFSARLADTAFNRHVVEAASDGLGVSIGYRARRQWTVERSGVGRVRVVDEIEVLDHIAVLPPDGKMSPLFSGARCYGAKGEWLTCPAALRQRAEQYAYRLVKEQAGVRS